MPGFIYVAGAQAPSFSIVAVSEETVLQVNGDSVQKQSIIDRTYALHQELFNAPDTEADPQKIEELQQLANTLLFCYPADPTLELFISAIRRNVRPGHLCLWFYRENEILKFRTAQRFYTEAFEGPMPASNQNEYIQILDY